MQELPKCSKLGALECLEAVGAQVHSFQAVSEVMISFELGSIVARRR
jgi:hypothetical protein